MTTFRGKTIQVLFPAEAIARRNLELAREIAQHRFHDLLVISVLKGSFIFAADLIRAMHGAGLAPEVELLVFLPRDVREHEPVHALDGGPYGTRVLEQAVRAGAGLLRPGGSLLLEVGGEQDSALAGVLAECGFGPLGRHEDDDGDLRGIEAEWAPAAPN